MYLCCTESNQIHTGMTSVRLLVRSDHNHFKIFIFIIITTIIDVTMLWITLVNMQSTVPTIYHKSKIERSIGIVSHAYKLVSWLCISHKGTMLLLKHNIQILFRIEVPGTWIPGPWKYKTRSKSKQNTLGVCSSSHCQMLTEHHSILWFCLH